MSANLNAPALVGGQANPETTVNDAIGVLDAALTETLVVDLTLDETLSSADYRSAIRIDVTTTGSAKTLTVPAVKRLVFVANDGTHSITLKCGTATFTITNGAGGFFYTDGTTNGLVQLSSGGGGGGGGGGADEPFDVATFVPGLPIGGQTVLRFNVVRAFTWLATLPGSVFNAGTAATASAVFTIKQNGTSIGTLTWAISGTVPTVSFASDVIFAANDVITIVAPGSADATLADVSLSFAGTRPASTALVPADLGVFIPGLPGVAATVLRFNAVREFVWKSGLTGSLFSAGVASTGTATFTIKQNGSSIGTLVFTASATGVATFGADVFFAVNDIITVVAPGSQDATLADVGLNFLGSR